MLRQRGSRTLQPTKGLLAHRVAREMEKFIVRFGALVLRAEADTFHALWIRQARNLPGATLDNFVLLSIERASAGSLQPRIGTWTMELGGS